MVLQKQNSYPWLFIKYMNPASRYLIKISLNLRVVTCISKVLLLNIKYIISPWQKSTCQD
jgi:hypothetical protein